MAKITGLDVCALSILISGCALLLIGILTFLSAKAPWVLAGAFVLLFIWATIRVWRLLYGKV